MDRLLDSTVFSGRGEQANRQLTANAVDTAAFLDAWAETWPYHLLMAIKPDGKPRARGFAWPAGRAAALTWIKRAGAAGYNCYFSVNVPRPMHKKPGKEDIRYLRGLHSDIDPADDAPFADERARLAALADTLAGIALPPTEIVDSGNGVQVCYRFAKAIEATETTIAEIEGLNRRLAAATGAPIETWNIDRVMRIPGTINRPNAVKRKKGRTAGPAKTLYLNARTYAREEIEAVIPTVEAATGFVAMAPGTGNGSAAGGRVDLKRELPPPATDDEVTAIIADNPELQAIVDQTEYEGILELTDSSQSGWDLSWASRLKHIGLDEDDVAAFLVWYRRYHETRPGSDVKKKSDRADYIWRTVALAFKPTSKLNGGTVAPEAETSGASTKAAGAMANRPVIRYHPDPFHLMVQAAERALLDLGPPPEIYQRGMHLVRVARVTLQEAGRLISKTKIAVGSPVIMGVNAAWLTGKMSEAARWDHYDARRKAWVPMEPPTRVLAVLLANAGSWRSPALLRVIEVPTMRPDGTIIDEPGYDAETGVLYDPGEIDFGKIPLAPTKADALAALEVFKELLGGFPFVDHEPEPKAEAGPDDGAVVKKSPLETVSFSVAVAAILTALIRTAVRTAPGFAFDAPEKGTGKSLLMATVALIATGRDATTFTHVSDRDEERKRLYSILRSGFAVIGIDNISDPVASDALSTILTEAAWTDRVLGVSETPPVPTCATFLFTGNNIEFQGDLATRVLMSSMDAKVEQPDERAFEVNLRDFIPANRVALVRAGLIILRAYQAAGRPVTVVEKPSNNALEIKQFGRFEDWSATIRAPLVWLGLPDPVVSRTYVIKVDDEKQFLVDFIEEWYARYGSRETTVRDVVTNLDECFLARWEMWNGKYNTIALGVFLNRNKNRVVSGKRFMKGNSKTDNQTRWRVEIVTKS